MSVQREERERIMPGLKQVLLAIGLISLASLKTAPADTIVLGQTQFVGGSAGAYVWDIPAILTDTGDLVVANYNNMGNVASGYTIGKGVNPGDPNNTTGLVGLTGLDDGGVSVLSYTSGGWTYTADTVADSITAVYVGPPSYVSGVFPATVLPTISFFDVYNTVSGSPTAGYLSNDVGQNPNGTPDITPGGASNEYGSGELDTPGISSAPAPLPSSMGGGLCLLALLASVKLAGYQRKPQR
jgi:hypothetical protein